MCYSLLRLLRVQRTLNPLEAVMCGPSESEVSSFQSYEPAAVKKATKRKSRAKAVVSKRRKAVKRKAV